MATAGEHCQRLVAVLEEFILSEALLLRAGHFSEARLAQERAGPVVAELARLGAAADEFTRQRLLELLRQRQVTVEWLTGEIDRVESRLRALDETSLRITRLRPVYGTTDAPTESWRRIA